MRRGILIVGVVLVVLGVLLLGVSYVLGGASQSVTLTQGSVLEITASGVGSSTLTLSWSGGTASTQLELTTCSNSACSVVSSSALATGTGASGSLSASISPGTQYAVVLNSGPPLSLDYTASGITYGMVIGIVLVVLGVVVALLGARAKARTARPVEYAESSEPVAPAAPASPYVVPAPITPETADAPMPEPVGVRPPPPEPPSRFMPASADQPAARTGPVAGARPSQTCSYCGTVNESWITNCRKCKRPLTSTGRA